MAALNVGAAYDRERINAELALLRGAFEIPMEALPPLPLRINVEGEAAR